MAANGISSNKITRQQQRGIAALLTTKTVAEAAKQTGVSLRTMFRWMNEDAAFKAALAEAESELIATATRRLLQYQDAAITTVATIMLDKQNRATVRLRAATTVIETMLKLRELNNFEQRLIALEANLGKSI
jgi:hypothetical protein